MTSSEECSSAPRFSLSGRYTFQGRLAGAGMQQAVADVRSSGGVRLADRTVLPELVILDDRGTRTGVRQALGVERQPTSSSGPTAAIWSE